MTNVKKEKKAPYKNGSLSDQEKRTIEQLIKFETFKTIGDKLNRNPCTIRKWCQRNGVVKDSTSVNRQIEDKKKRSPHFEELANILTDREMDLAVKIYTELMKQFGGDILASEEIQVIDFCVISALLNRALSREKELLKAIDQQNALMEALEKEKESLGEDDDKENWYDRIDQVSLRLATLSEEMIQAKKNQLAFIDKKEKAQTKMNASRDQRRDELSKMNENWGDFVVYLKSNPGFRAKLGLDLEKNRLGIKEEFIRLSQLHEYADGEVDYPVFNSDVVETEYLLNSLEEEVENEF